MLRIRTYLAPSKLRFENARLTAELASARRDLAEARGLLERVEDGDICETDRAVELFRLARDIRAFLARPASGER